MFSKKDRIGSWIDAILFVAGGAIKMDRCFGRMTRYLGQFWAFHARRDALQVVQFAEKLNTPRMTRM